MTPQEKAVIDAAKDDVAEYIKDTSEYYSPASYSRLVKCISDLAESEKPTTCAPPKEYSHLGWHVLVNGLDKSIYFWTGTFKYSRFGQYFDPDILYGAGWRYHKPVDLE